MGLNESTVLQSIKITFKGHTYSLFTILGYFIGFCISLVVARDIFRFIELANRGFNLDDEAYYVASYATRKSVGRSFTGATYILGPVFEILNYNVTSLRIFKVILLGSTGCYLGIQVCGYLKYVLKIRNNKTFETRDILGWEITVISSCILLTYSTYFWAPNTPSYNDLNTVFLLLLSGSILNLFKREQFQKVPWVNISCLSFLWVLALYNKPPSAIVIFPFTIFALIEVWRKSKKTLQIISVYAAGAILAIVTIIILAGSLKVIVDSYHFLQLIRNESYSTSFLLTSYKDQLLDSINYELTTHKWQYIWLALVTSISPRIPTQYKIIGVVSAPFPLIYSLTNKLYLSAGSSPKFNVGLYFVIAVVLGSIISVLAFQISTWLLSRLTWDKRQKNQDETPVKTSRSFYLELLVVTCMFVSMPFIQLLGTNNHMFFGISFSYASWFVLLLILAAYSFKSWPSSAIIFLLAIFLVVGMRQKIVDGFLNQPYGGQVAISESKYEIERGKLKGIKVEKSLYKYLNEIQSLQEDLDIKSGHTFLGFYNFSGEIYLMDGISPGEPWYIRTNPIRNSNSIAYGCERDELGKGNLPVVFYWSGLQLDPIIIDTLNKCGIDFPSDFKKVKTIYSPHENLDVEIYLPK